MDTQDQQEDEDEMFVNEEPEETAAIKQPVIMGGTGGGGGQHGGLVQKIIDSQKQYTGPEKQVGSDSLIFPVDFLDPPHFINSYFLGEVRT